MMSTRESLEWFFKQLDHSVGLSFKGIQISTFLLCNPIVTLYEIHFEALYSWFQLSLCFLLQIYTGILLFHLTFTHFVTARASCYHATIRKLSLPLGIQVTFPFTANFHFALVGHLLKGLRHPAPTTVSRTSRVLITLLSIVAKPHKRDKFEV